MLSPPRFEKKICKRSNLNAATVFRRRSSAFQRLTTSSPPYLLLGHVPGIVLTLSPPTSPRSSPFPPSCAACNNNNKSVVFGFTDPSPRQGRRRGDENGGGVSSVNLARWKGAVNRKRPADFRNSSHRIVTRYVTPAASTLHPLFAGVRTGGGRWRIRYGVITWRYLRIAQAPIHGIFMRCSFCLSPGCPPFSLIQSHESPLHVQFCRCDCSSSRSIKVASCQKGW